VLKPALGRVGEDVGIPGVTPRRDLERIGSVARRSPGDWVAQRRFEIAPLRVDGRDVHPCLGVFTVEGRAAGAYGRLAPTPLVDGKAADAPVLQIPQEETE
jgi:hypothetical protein